MSLNPALEDVHHCPRCGKPPTIDFPRSIACPHCGYAAFYNPKPVACAITHDASGAVLLIKRAFPPGDGRWSIPGGFVDLGETVEAAAIRELKEELGVEIELTGVVGVYSKPDQRTVVVVYAATTRGTPVRTEEALDVRAFATTEIPWQTLAFWSDERALRHHLSRPPGGDGAAA